MTAREDMLAGRDYLADDPELVEMARRGRRLNDAFNEAATYAEGAQVLAELLGSVGADVHLRRPLHVDYGAHLHVGARTFANFGLVALDCAEIRVGEDVQIGPNVQLLTATHPLDAERRRAKWESALPVTVGDNVWLGGGVIVCPGVTIGADSVVGAGSVVTKDLPPGVLALGNPARIVRNL